MENPVNLVLVEDNADLRDDIQFQLNANGLHVMAVESAEKLDTYLDGANFDIAVLDIGLPGEDGLSLAKRLRQRFPDMGIIMLTAMGQLDTRLQGFDSGADIYLVKPVDLRELLAQVRALYRRVAKVESEAKQQSCWVLKSAGRELLSPQGNAISLTHMESIVMQLLAEHAGQKVERSLFIDLMAGDASHAFDPHRLEVCVSRLRQKILDVLPRDDASPSRVLPLKTARGVGYTFTADILIQ